MKLEVKREKLPAYHGVILELEPAEVAKLIECLDDVANGFTYQEFARCLVGRLSEARRLSASIITGKSVHKYHEEGR